MISRRDLLKRGAFVGGAVLWVAPVVQVVGMGKAFARDVSPGCSRYCIKWDATTNAPPTNPSLTCSTAGVKAYPIWGNTWTALGDGVANALTCPADGTDTDAGATFITAERTGREFVVYGNQPADMYIAFPPDVKLAYLKDVGDFSVGAKCGQALVTFDPVVKDDPCFKDPNDVPYKQIHIPGCNNSKDISHIELIVDWCPNGAPQ